MSESMIDKLEREANATVRASRDQCYCGNTRKPCQYHEGMSDGVEVGQSALPAILSDYRVMETALTAIAEKPCILSLTYRGSCADLLKQQPHVAWALCDPCIARSTLASLSSPQEDR